MTIRSPDPDGRDGRTLCGSRRTLAVLEPRVDLGRQRALGLAQPAHQPVRCAHTEGAQGLPVTLAHRPHCETSDGCFSCDRPGKLRCRVAAPVTIDVGGLGRKDRLESRQLIAQSGHRELPVRLGKRRGAGRVLELRVHPQRDTGRQQRLGIGIAKHHHAHRIDRARLSGLEDPFVIATRVAVVVGGDDQGRSYGVTGTLVSSGLGRLSSSPRICAAACATI
jgi:hypothetical protein